jgi:hypothetical protein
VANGIELATAYVSLNVDGSKVDSGVRRSLSGVDAQADKVGKSAGKRMGAGMSAGILGAAAKIAGPLAAVFAGVKIGQFFGDALTEAIEAQKVSAATDAIIKSTGGAAKVSAENVAALSEALSVKVGVDDELIQTGANLLLTFKNVRNEAGEGNKIFDKAVTLTQDLAAAGFGSVESASKTLGKALQDPVKGMTALSRAGVTFTDSQKKQIKALVASGDLLGAQRLILAEIESQVGGVGEATATTGEKVRVAWNNVKEQLGTALLPTLERVGKWFLTKGIPAITAFVTALTGKGDPTKMVTEGMGKFAKAGAVVRDVFIAVSAAVSAFFGALTGTGDPTKMVTEGTAKFARAGAVLRDVFNAVWPVLQRFGAFLVNDLWPALKDGWAEVQPGLQQARDILVDAFGDSGGGGSVKSFAAFLTGTLIPAIATFVNNWLPVLARQWAIVVNAVQAAVTVMTTIRNAVTTVTSTIVGAFLRIMQGFQSMLAALGNVPGFGWAKDAAAKMQVAIDKLAGIKRGIDALPRKKTVTVSVNYVATYSGRFDDAPTGYTPGRASGGPVRAGQPYIVGEKRPELFVPSENGMILPRVPESMGENRTYEQPINVYGDVRTQSVVEFEEEMYHRRRRAVLSAPGR